MTILFKKESIIELAMKVIAQNFLSAILTEEEFPAVKNKYDFFGQPLELINTEGHHYIRHTELKENKYCQTERSFFCKELVLKANNTTKIVISANVSLDGKQTTEEFSYKVKKFLGNKFLKYTCTSTQLYKTFYIEISNNINNQSFVITELEYETLLMAYSNLISEINARNAEEQQKIYLKANQEMIDKLLDSYKVEKKIV